MRTASSPVAPRGGPAGSPRVPSSRRTTPAPAATPTARRTRPVDRAVRSAPQRPRPVLGPPRAPSRARAGSRHGLVGPERREALRDLVAGIAAGAAAVAAVALALLPGVPVGVALVAGATVSLSAGAVVLASWARSAVQDGASPDAARRQAVIGLLAAHAVASVPIGLAVLAAT